MHEDFTPAQREELLAGDRAWHDYYWDWYIEHVEEGARLLRERLENPYIPKHLNTAALLSEYIGGSKVPY